MATIPTTKIAVLTGQTYDYRRPLQAGGWKWDAPRKAWTRAVAEGDTEQWIMSRYVRALNGIRNRGEFKIEII